jgi:hypothetical protein
VLVVPLPNARSCLYTLHMLGRRCGTAAPADPISGPVVVLAGSFGAGVKLSGFECKGEVGRR